MSKSRDKQTERTGKRQEVRKWERMQEYMEVQDTTRQCVEVQDTMRQSETSDLQPVAVRKADLVGDALVGPKPT